MKRLCSIMILLLSLSAVQAQRDCTANLTEDECELYEEAISELYDDGQLDVFYVLRIELAYQASTQRIFHSNGFVSLERNRDGAIIHFEADTNSHIYRVDAYVPSGRNYSLPVVMEFDENLLAHRFGTDSVEGLEFDTPSIPIESLFPSFHPEMLIDGYFVQSQETLDGSVSLYQYTWESALIESPFRSLYPLLFGEETGELSGTGYYEGNLAIHSDTEEIYGTVFRSIETIDGTDFGQVLPITVSVHYELHIRNEEFVIFAPITDIESYLEDSSDYEDAAEFGFLGLLEPILRERVRAQFPPLRLINTIVPTAIPSPVPTASPTANASPTARIRHVSLPCSAIYAGEEGVVVRVVHQEADEDSVVIMAARAGQEITLVVAVDTADGRWYQIESNNRTLGYVHENNLVLGEDCTE